MDLFNENNQVKSSWVKWGKIGDNIFGTLIDVREINSQFPGKENERVKIYEIKADGGEFHELDDKRNAVAEPTKIVEGEIWNIGGKAGIDVQMRRIKVGQKLGIKFTDEKPSKNKGFNPLKIIKVYTDGSIDEEWLATYDAMAKAKDDWFYKIEVDGKDYFVTDNGQFGFTAMLPSEY